MHELDSLNEQQLKVSELFLNLTEEQLKGAEENLEQYVELILRVYERIRRDPEAYRTFRALTKGESDSSIKDIRSNPAG